MRKRSTATGATPRGGNAHTAACDAHAALHPEAATSRIRTTIARRTSAGLIRSPSKESEKHALRAALQHSLELVRQQLV